MSTVENILHEDVEHILAQRAARYADVVRQSETANVIAEIVVTSVGDEKLGFPVQSLSNIIKTPNIAALPSMPSLLKGIVQYRGEIFSVVDIAKWFGVSGKSMGKHLATLDTARGKLGILIDDVLHFRTVSVGDVAAHLENGTTRTGHPIQFTTRDAVMVLDIEELIKRDELQVNIKN
ncbi:MAG: chemotaxis protein CheW [Deltaproteobacteria bacterium]|nr:chemotaxis protein CheW [Deltaproteobacteria bacterium]